MHTRIHTMSATALFFFLSWVTVSAGNEARYTRVPILKPAPAPIITVQKYSRESIFDRNSLSRAEQVAKAMGLVETGGAAKSGASGEMKTIWQWLPATWQRISSDYNCAVHGSKNALPLNTWNEELVVVWKCKCLLAKGYHAKEIGMIWNTSLGGVEKPLVKKGTNKHGVRYDSEHHGEKVLIAFNSLSK